MARREAGRVDGLIVDVCWGALSTTDYAVLTCVLGGAVGPNKSG